MTHRIDERCTGCTACARQCPVAAIRGEAHGLHRVEPSLCIDCGVCGLLCPVEAIQDAAGCVVRRVPRNRRPRPVVDPTLCNGCALCVDVCPFACRELVGPAHRGVAFLANVHACVGCAECARCCIKGAIAMEPLDLRAFDPAELEKAARALLNG